jgi:translation initiation factor IF-3
VAGSHEIKKLETKAPALRVNRQIRVPRVRLIGADGKQIGVVPTEEARRLAQEAGLDLVEVVPASHPPVCKIIDYGKFRYDQTKREKESKKAQHQIRVKEIKLKPAIDEHDFNVKLKAARGFLQQGNKVKVTCMFKGRQVAYPELGERVVERLCVGVEDLGAPESPPKRMGRTITTVIAPLARKKVSNDAASASSKSQG